MTQAKSLKVYSEKYQPKLKTIISAKNFHINKKNNVCYLPLYLASEIIHEDVISNKIVFNCVISENVNEEQHFGVN